MLNFDNNFSSICQSCTMDLCYLLSNVHWRLKWAYYEFMFNNKSSLLSFDTTVLTDAVARGSTTKSANISLMGFPSSFSIVPRTCTTETKTRISNHCHLDHCKCRKNIISGSDKNYRSSIHSRAGMHTSSKGRGGSESCNCLRTFM